MRVLIDTVGVSGQGGGAVVSELLDALPAARPDWSFGVCVMKAEARDYAIPDARRGLEILFNAGDSTYLHRLHWLQRRLPALAAQWRPDWILSLANLLPAGRTGRQAVMVQQINILKEEMRGVEFSLRTRARYAFLRQAVLSSARAADAVLVQSEVMRDRLLRLEARLDGRIHVIPSGFRSRLDRWQVREEIRSQFDGDGERKLIMYPSYPRPHKNYERLFEAWRQVSEQLPEWRLGLTLASFPAESGSGATSGGGSAKIRNGSMKNSILMLGALNPAEVDFVLRHSAAMVFPSLSESFGLPLAEAMHAGCPIAAADLAYAREVADRAAIYFDPYDVSSIARAMLRIATDNGLRDCLRREGHLREPMYDYNTIAEQYCHLIERLTGTGGLRTGEQSTGNK